jgi:hypothetical protein
VKILVTGDREWTSKETIREALSKFPKDTIVVHGNCRGADLMADDIAKELFTEKPLAYPANWKKYGKAAGVLRNQQMLDENTDIRVVLAFHNDIEKSKGTKDMLKRAKKCKWIMTKLITEETE